MVEKQEYFDELNQNLFKEYTNNKNNKTKNNIVCLNQPLVSYIIGKYYLDSIKYMPEIKNDIYQEGVIGLMYAVDKFDLEFGCKFSTYACVPTSTKILTKRGWKYYYELIDGDETIGYNNGKSEWTKIKGVAKYNNAPLVNFGDSLWHTKCTPNHKWLISVDEKTELKPLYEWPKSKLFEWPKNNKRPNVKLITSAPFIGGKSELTPNEAAILAWILSDGSIKKFSNNEAKYAIIIQSEKKYFQNIKNLLLEENALSSNKKRPYGDCHNFYIKQKYLDKIWIKSKLKHQTLIELVLDLTPEARKSWFNAWYLAEGTMGKNHITQNFGEKQEAIELCAFLEGHQGVHTIKKNDKCSIVAWHNRHRTPRRCIQKEIGRGEVWCPNTELGSWTAKSEDNFVFLTGNTWWVKQRINNFLSANSIIQIPSNIRMEQSKLFKQLKEEGKNLIELNEDNIEQYELTDKKLKRIKSAVASKKILSLQSTLSKSNKTYTYEETLVDHKESVENFLDKRVMIDTVKKALKSMPEKRKLILLLRYGVIKEIKNK